MKRKRDVTSSETRPWYDKNEELKGMQRAGDNVQGFFFKKQRNVIHPVRYKARCFNHL